jgi:small conductance mechanosensitive channel
MNLEQIKETLVSLATVWGIKIIGVVVAVIAGWMIAGWLSKRLANALEGRGIDATVARFLANIVRWGVIVVVIVGCLGVFGIETTSFAAVLASAGLAVGLAFQGTLSNFAAGVMLVVFRPFKSGDVVKVAGVVGACEEIDLFTTLLKTPDARRIIIPNSQIVGAIIENLSHFEERRVDISVGVAYDASVGGTRDVLEKAASQINGVLKDPAPAAFLHSLGDSAVTWQVRVWCKADDYWDVYEATTRKTKEALDEAGLGIPYATMDVNLVQAAQ